MTKRAIEITSSAHAMAIALYLMMTALEIIAIAGVRVAPSFVDLLGPALAGIWALLLTFSGLVCATVCVLPHRGSAIRISRALIIEFWSALLLACVAGLYGYALTDSGKGVTTLIFVSTVVLGCLARDVQILLDLRRIRRARTHVGTTQVAADPEDR